MVLRSNSGNASYYWENMKIFHSSWIYGVVIHSFNNSVNVTYFWQSFLLCYYHSWFVHIFLTLCKNKGNVSIVYVVFIIFPPKFNTGNKSSKCFLRRWSGENTLKYILCMEQPDQLTSVNISREKGENILRIRHMWLYSNKSTHV